MVFGRESENLVNGAIMGSRGRVQAMRLLDACQSAFPVLDRWGVVGPFLITRLLNENSIQANIVPQNYFYPIRAEEIFKLYLPEEKEEIFSQEQDWYCITLWGETLSRYGLKYMSPPNGSYLEDLFRRRPMLGQIKGDPIGMARYLQQNQRLIKEFHSRRHVAQLIYRWFAKNLKLNNAAFK